MLPTCLKCRKHWQRDTHGDINLDSGITARNPCDAMFDPDVLDTRAAENWLALNHFSNASSAAFNNILTFLYHIEFLLLYIEPAQRNCESTFFTATQSYISCTTSNGRTGWPWAKLPLSLPSHIGLLSCFEREMNLGNNSDPQSPDGPKSSLLSTLLWGHPDVPQLSHRQPNSRGCGCNHNLFQNLSH